MEQPISDPIFERLRADVLEGIASADRGELVSLEEFRQEYGLGNTSEDDSST